MYAVYYAVFRFGVSAVFIEVFVKRFSEGGYE